VKDDKKNAKHVKHATCHYRLIFATCLKEHKKHSGILQYD